MKVLVTGGAGYIGSHTILALLERGYEEIYSIDNYLNSDENTYKRIEKISGKKIAHFNLDLANTEQLNTFFDEHKVDGIIHFGALKSVPESVDSPLLYYHNNLNGLLNLVSVIKQRPEIMLIFSSSCSVYGNQKNLPVTEETPFGKVESPYANTKKMGEDILNDFSAAQQDSRLISLRYFNPAGAHQSGLIGETLTKRPSSLIPILAQQAIGMRESFTVFGTNYNTKDGSCIRDYVHVSDIAKAHVLALEYLAESQPTYEVFNLGSGTGSTTLEVVKAFESVNQVSLNYALGDRRAGDVESIYANNEKAKNLLKWKPELGLEEIVASAWKWQQNADQ